MWRWIIIMLLPTMVWAQSYPEYERTTVNDFADLLPDADETLLVSRLEQLYRDTDVELTVVTLPRQSDYAPDMSMEQFATGLFNHWGVGNAQRNDGVMILVLVEDRAMRIELGRGYGRDWDRAAAEVIDQHFLDRFAAGDFVGGLSDGTEATIREIVMPFRAGDTAPSGNSGNGGSSGSDSGEPWIIGIFIALTGLIIGRRQIGDAMARFRTCPQCGHRGLRQRRRTQISATTSSSGWGLRTTTCPNCGYHDEHRYIIPQRSKSRSGSFGGGSSGGGGASGRW